ncbi:MAG: 8-oxoguanine DNA glycosylase, N-terminal domain-containing protein, partial [Clostridiales Family XIII bacterium]|nr:8-oxoguanine DNA glycosylase, N-terminal domain-containing protein [Clostridiales Family XIII bacterium]
MAEGLVKHEFHNVLDFDLDHVFTCGQCFRWEREEDGSYSGIVEGSFANVSYRPRADMYGGRLTVWSNLLADSPSLREKYWRNYLDLDRDYGRIKMLLS